MGKGIWTDEELARLRRLRAAGWTAPRIARALGRTDWSVYRVLAAAGLKALRCPGVDPDGDPDVLRVCAVCHGPVYRDEPTGRVCPDCRRALEAINASHRQQPPDQGPRIRRLLYGPGPRHHGYQGGRP